jgi:ATP-dependent helicase/nuclease subunit B
MPLTLVTGSANTGKTGVVHRALRDALAAGLPVVLALPTRPDVRRTEAELGRVGLVGAKLAVLDDWIDELWSLYGDGRSVIGPTSRAALLQRAVQETPLRLLAASAEHPGFVRLLADVAQRLGRPPQGATGNDREVARVLERYEEVAAEHGLVERAIAARILADSPPRLRGPVIVNRFTDLSEAQERLLVAIAKHTHVGVALTWEPDLPATAALDPLVERMFDSAEVVPLVGRPPGSELERLGERLYCPGDPVRPEGELRTALAAGDEAECALAARAARSLLDEGFAGERIAIVFRDAGRRLGLLAAALSAEGVTADLDVALPVAATPFGSALTALLDACLAPSRERLLAFLLTPYAAADPSAVTAADVRWRRYRVTGERLLRDAAAIGASAARSVGAARRVAAKGLDAATAGEWKELADTLLASGAASRPPGAGETLLDAAAHRSVLRAIDEVARIQGLHLDAAGVLRLLREATASTGGAERAGAVQVTEVHRVRSRRFDALVLGGLTADEFSAERSEPVASELARRLGALPGLEEREAERMLFYLVVTRARRRLVLIRQETDARGEPRRPSVFWDEVVDVYLEDAATNEIPASPPGVPCERLGLADLAWAAPAYAPGRRKQRAAVGAGRAVRRPRGRLNDGRVLEALAATAEFSVTELETYAACPYRWFYERAIRPAELDVEVDARERGSRAHRLLAAFYGQLGPRLGLRRIVPERLAEVLALFEQVAKEVEAEARTPTMGLRDGLTMAQAESWARSVLQDDAGFLPGFEPLHHEFAFGERAGRPFMLAGVALRGSIDRIDAGPTGLVVSDYKSDRQPRGRESFGGQGLMQVPVYAEAARTLLEKPVVAGLYRSFRSLAARGFKTPAVDLGCRGSEKDDVDEAALDELLGEAAARVRMAAAGIRAGEIPARPARRATCEWCGARTLCEESR